MRWLVVLALVTLPAACARPVGDFGRAEPSMLHDSAMPALGRLAAEARGAPVSNAPLSDEDRLMRDRIWRFLVLPHGDGRAARAAELARTGLGSPTGAQIAPGDYYRWLIGTPYRSSAVRYATLAADVEADLATLPETFAAICKVQKIDRQRAIAAAAIAGLPAEAREDAQARIAENLRLVAWFTQSLTGRHAAYSYALDRLLVATPDRAARRVDGLIADLGAWVGQAQAGRFCEDKQSATAPTARSRPWARS